MRDQLLPLATTAMERSPSLTAHMQKSHQMLHNVWAPAVSDRPIANKIHNQYHIYLGQEDASKSLNIDFAMPMYCAKKGHGEQKQDTGRPMENLDNGDCGPVMITAADTRAPSAICR